ncbi:sensor domain-containing diguanylate cyclase [Clostridium botulinum]|uniref:sensor domain-containing diguanylate cyclase n=1 Tax=Clostridium botulinum TaxID=1491 RepID=UPI0005973A1D|nr:sensor domain-containing diguanylate cyclase [Clostridium botulinum]KIL08015.1 diguanylate cyclase [Clostridium botulinum]MBY6809913.1 GGDEF domain-containing protein [Clostridium botulinum]MBY6823569.1 GGDEF domain-containing protein [Clostridium botulinum]MBY6834180.1 GGDEF domain-containing protein [Clostridium botulinum]MBY6933646.1 GGDEF domain-containing protein [Clostridium botulinum]
MKFPELQEHIKVFINNESYIDYFREFAVNTIEYDPHYVKSVMEYILDISKESNYELAIHWCLIYIGWCEQLECNFEESIKLHLMSKEYFEKINYLEGVSVACNALLVDYLKIGQFDLAIINALRGADIARKLGNKELTIILLLNISYAYIDSYNYDEAINILKKLKVYKNEFNFKHEILMLMVLAECALSIDDLERAFNYATYALKMIKKNNTKMHKVELFAIIADILYKKNEESKAIKLFEKSLEILKQDDNYLRAKILIRWGQCSLYNKNYILAEKKLLGCLNLLEETNFITLESKVYKQLSNIYEKLGKYKEAFEAMKNYDRYEKRVQDLHSSSWFCIFNYKNLEEKADAYRELYNKIERISELGKEIISILDIDKLLYTIYIEVKKLIDTDIFGIALFNEQKNALDYKLFIENGHFKNLCSIPISSRNSFGVYCFKSKKEILINNIENEYTRYVKKFDINKYKNAPYSILYIPIIIKNKSIGVISVQSYRKNAYTRNDCNELKILSSYIAIALQNGKLFNTVEHFAKYDSLTGMFNRNVILTQGENILNNRLETKQNFSIIMIDVDFFKQINDNYGHDIGDIVLKDVSSIIKNEIRNTDYLGRYGGEEFLVLLPNINLDEAKKIADRIRISVENYKYYYLTSEKYNRVTLSLGVYEFNKNEFDFFEGVKKADKALYMAKSLGRNMAIEYSG